MILTIFALAVMVTGSVITRLERYFKLFPAPEKYADLVTERGKINNFSQFRRFIALKEELLFLLNYSKFSGYYWRV